MRTETQNEKLHSILQRLLGCSKPLHQYLTLRAGDALKQDGPGALVTFRLPFDPTAPDALPVTPTLHAPQNAPKLVQTSLSNFSVVVGDASPACLQCVSLG